MKFHIPLIMSCMAFAVTTTAEIQNSFEGIFLSKGDSDSLTLSLKNSEGSQYAGELSGSDFHYKLNGAVESGALRGMLVGEQIYYVASFEGPVLHMLLAKAPIDGYPATSASETLVFHRQGSDPVGQDKDLEGYQDKVVINGKVLSDDDIAEMTKVYSKAPIPGNYWYDSRSGLYGVVGYPAYGYMYPGHDFGTYPPDVSQGNTNVFVNGRNIPLSEWTVWSYMLGEWIQPGNYWLDANGDAGYVGLPTPTVNLFIAAQQNRYRGQGGSGDNFWSTRFSAGNSNADNSQGYVSVPGHGPVGYGF